MVIEVIESGDKGNIDDKSLSNEIISILKNEFNENEIDYFKSQSSIYEMYIPFVRGHYKEPMDIPKTKLFLWMKQVRIISILDIRKIRMFSKKIFLSIVITPLI